jgi:hypothetical protein
MIIKIILLIIFIVKIFDLSFIACLELQYNKYYKYKN